MIEVRLFGGFDLRADGGPVEVASARARSLLAYLVLHEGVPQRREHLAGLLWPDSAEQQARTNLRHLLHTLRAGLPDAGHHLRATSLDLTWRGAPADVRAFEAAAARADDGADDASARAAVELYTGDLLDGWYDDWIGPERDRLRGRVIGVLTALGSRLEARGELREALACAERARDLDRLDEETYRALMRRHDALGDRTHAVRAFHECAAALRLELGVEPSPDTVAAYEALLPGDDGSSGTHAPGMNAAAEFVGRRPERARLTQRWRAACAGRAQFVVLTGEPGIGKTRLVEEFRHWAARRGAVTAAARSYPAEGALAYAPVVEWLRAPALARRRGHLPLPDRAALSRLLPELADAEPAGPGSEPGSRLHLFEAAARALDAGRVPVLLVADDLQAADPQSLQFLHYLLRARPGAPLMVLATARLADTDAGHPLRHLLSALGAGDRYAELELRQLDVVETGLLARRSGRELAAADVDRLHAETGGNPLFVVESLRAGWPAGSGLAPRVQAVLEARLGQLSESARHLLELAATAGSSVPVDVLVRAAPGPPDRAARDLDELWRRRLLLATDGDTYDFSHEKLREVAYGSLSPARRRRHHGVLARALMDADAGRADAVAGRIAAHLHAAGAADDAVAWYRRAAAAAQWVYADAEAADQLEKAWRIVGPTHRPDLELEILTSLPGPLAAAEGYASARLGAVLARAFELCARLGREPDAPLVRARAMAVLSHSDFEAALEHGAHLRARGENDDVLAVEGDFVRGVAAAWRGEPERARGYLEAALERYRPENRPAHLLLFAQDPQVLCLMRLAHLHVFLDAPERAVELRDRSLGLAREIAHPFTLGGALVFAALIDLERSDHARVRERVTELAGLADRVDAPPISLSANALDGLVEVFDGRPAAGLARIDRALADPGRRSAPGLPSMLLRIRLAACQHAEDAGEARATAEQLLAGDVRVWDARARAVLAAKR